MSHFLAPTWNPISGQTEVAEWLDDYFGRHRYGVRFADGEVYPEEAVTLTDEEIKDA